MELSLLLRVTAGRSFSSAVFQCHIVILAEGLGFYPQHAKAACRGLSIVLGFESLHSAPCLRGNNVRAGEATQAACRVSPFAIVR